MCASEKTIDLEKPWLPSSFIDRLDFIRATVREEVRLAHSFIHEYRISSYCSRKRFTSSNTGNKRRTDMTITSRVKDELFETDERRPIRIAPTFVQSRAGEDDLPAIKSRGIPWSEEEHERFLDALAQFPYGPWKVIAELIGTRTARQAMSHAQKYRQKIVRRKRYVAKQGTKDKEQHQGNGTRRTPRSAPHVAAGAAAGYDMPPLEVHSVQACADTSELLFGVQHMGRHTDIEYVRPATAAMPFTSINAFEAPNWDPFLRDPDVSTSNGQLCDGSDQFGFIV